MTESILLKNVLLDDEETSIYIEGNTISEIGKGLTLEAAHTLDCGGKVAIPGLVNCHTHAAMTLFRGYADDLELHEWLEKHIWPLEAKLTEDDVYWGTKLACLEMIKSGTTCFNDMYWHMPAAAKAVDEIGLRGVMSAVFIDLFDKEKAEEHVKLNRRIVKEVGKKTSSRVVPALGPHAIYTVSEESLLWTKEYAEEHDLLIHFHLAETRKEVDDCVKQHGKTPVEYLDSLGFLSSRLTAAHCVWLNDRDIKLLAENNVQVVHNPVSNMKLSVGGVLLYTKLKSAGVNICLGTDGCASNNNLDMFESMKYASLLQKHATCRQTILPAQETYSMATVNGAKALRINSGAVEEGRLADLVLVDLNRPELTPHYNLASDLVYAANGSCVDTVIVDGQILMQDRKVDGEEELMQKAGEVARDLINRA